jgi:nicotinamidase-related amidase
MLASDAVLIPIDLQRAFDDPSWGRRNNPDLEAQGLRLLAAWRRAGRPVINVKHNSSEAGSTLRAGQPGNAFKSGFEPQAGEALIEKTVNAAFIGTSLEADLRARGVNQILVFGLTTDMCVSTTARVGANLGFEVLVVGDVCATFDQVAPDGAAMAAELLHRAHLTTLNTEFARVVNADEVVAGLR